MRISIMQPGYLPWLGFFELIYNSELFVVLDDVQYTKKDWRNRNRIRTKDGWMWLTVPVLTKNNRFQLINEARVNPSIDWQEKHAKAIAINYCKARYYKDYFPDFKKVLNSAKWDSLADLDLELIYWLMKVLKINRPVIKSSALGVEGKKETKIIEICRKLGASELYDSKAASTFLEREKFDRKGINIIFQDYKHPVYNQVYEPFIPYMSTIDLLFNHGAESLEIIIKKS